MASLAPMWQPSGPSGLEADPPMTASPKLPGTPVVHGQPAEPVEQRENAWMRAEIERLLKVNYDLQQQVATKVPEPGFLSPERPPRGSRCQAALAAIEPVAVPEHRQSLASRGSSDLPDVNRWEAYGSVTAEKEALVNKLKAEESLQLETVRLATEAEARLSRVTAELDALRRKPSTETSSEVLESKLRQQLQAVRSDVDLRQRRVTDYDGSLQRSNSAVASLRADKQLALSDHNELREKALRAREQLESRIHCLRSARNAVLAVGGASPGRHMERIACARAACEELEKEHQQKEREVASTLQVLRDLQQVAAEQRLAVQRVQAGNEDLVARSSRVTAEHSQVTQQAASRVEQRTREKHSLSASVQQSEKQLSTMKATLATQRQRESEALAAEQRRHVEELQEAEASLWALRSRLEDASSELQGEQEKNLGLRQEVLALQAIFRGGNAFREAAREHIFKRLGSPDLAAVEASSLYYDREQDPSPGRSMPVWAKSHQQRLESELEQLRKWKFEAAKSVQRMAVGLRNLRDQYDHETQKGQELHNAWQRLGHAELGDGHGAFPSVAEAEEFLKSEGPGVARTRSNGKASRRSPKAKATRPNHGFGWWSSAQGPSRTSGTGNAHGAKAPKAKASSTGRLNKSTPSPSGHRVRAKLLS